MSTRMIEIWVGVFVAVGFAALFMLAMQVSNLTTFTAEGVYTVSGSFQNIGGLKVRSPVKASGVLVGRVSAIDYDPTRFEARVSMKIDESQRSFPVDTSASIYTAGLLGEQYISLDPGAEEAVLKDGDTIEYTQSAMILEQLIGKFLVNLTNK